MSSTCNAMAAKARAMLGERLTVSDYQVLLQKKSVSEIAEWLKTSALFKDCLEGINTKAIHRGQLEVLLRTDVFDRLSRLIRYADKNAKKFISVAMMNSESELILMCIRSFASAVDVDRHSMIARIPLYVEPYTSFSVEKLADVHDFDSLLKLLTNTPYYDVLASYSSNSLEEIDFVKLEHDLRELYYDAALKEIEQYGKGTDRDEMKKIILSRMELDNITVIYRLKKYFNVTPAKISEQLSPYYCFFSEKEIKDIVENSSADDVILKLQNSKYKSYIKNMKFSYIEHYTKVISYHMNYHFIQYHTDPNMVLLAYLLLSDIEIQNVVDTIEGVRYGIPADRIKQLLIY